MDSALQQLVDNWMKIDPDQKTKQKVQDMVKAGEFDKLRTILNPNNRLEFGTAGLRGEVAPGFCCMNQVVIMQTVQGLLKYVQEKFPNECKNGICVCHDARHYSDIFSDITAGVFLAAGIPVYYFRQLSPTPYAAWFSEHFKCVAGVMVTASHNPSQDNGYKVYGMNVGIQIVPPHDTNIQAAICGCTEIKQSTYDYLKYLDKSNKNYHELTETSDVTQLYYDAIKTLCHQHKENATLHCQFEYSAMWGVGTVPAQRGMREFGFDVSKINFFADSCIADPDFGGEKRPNPEERHNMVKLSEKAQKDTQVIIANDPDADRTALAERQKDGSWYIFHGNEIGAIMAQFMLDSTVSLGAKRHILCSTVSSQILKIMAEKSGCHFTETLTGFKWLATNAAAKPELSAVFAFEEAIGYSCGNEKGLVAGDKDGISTVAVLMENINQLYKSGKTVHDYLMQAYEKYGFHAWNNFSISVKSMADIATLFDKLIKNETSPFKKNGRAYQHKFGRFEVSRIRDMKTPGYDSKDGVPVLPTGSSEMITFYCGEVTCTFRPSGTEPKVKCYVEAVSPKGVAAAQEVTDQFKAEFLKVVQ